MTSNNWVDINIERGPVYGNLKNRVGLRLHVKANQELEQFMRNLSNGHTVPMESLSEEWVRIPQEDTEVYSIDFGRTPKEYTLSAVGYPIVIDSSKPLREDEDDGLRTAPPIRRLTGSPDKGMQVANLSFLTIAGVSREEGITIGLSGVYSLEYIMSARTILVQAAKQFLHDYIVPVTINLGIVQRG